MLTSDLWPYVAAKVGEFLLGKLWEFTSGLRCYSCAIPKSNFRSLPAPSIHTRASGTVAEGRRCALVKGLRLIFAPAFETLILRFELQLTANHASSNVLN